MGREKGKERKERERGRGHKLIGKEDKKFIISTFLGEDTLKKINATCSKSEITKGVGVYHLTLLSKGLG